MPEESRQKNEEQINDQVIEEVLLVNTLGVVELNYISSMLEQENIQFRVVEEGVGQYLTILHGRSFVGMSIYVKKEDFEKAHEIVESFVPTEPNDS